LEKGWGDEIYGNEKDGAERHALNKLRMRVSLAVLRMLLD